MLAHEYGRNWIENDYKIGIKHAINALLKVLLNFIWLDNWQIKPINGYISDM